MYFNEDIIYVYDGSFSGLLTAVFESFERHEKPCVIVSESDYVPTLFPSRIIVSNEEKAKRVKKGIKNIAGQRAWNLVRLGFLTSLEGRGALINDFVHMAVKYGAGVTNMLNDDIVNKLSRAVKALMQESHKYLGFVRFCESDSVLVSEIEPKNSVLPLIAPHFCDRFPNESFLIYDRTHGEALIWHKKKKVIVSLDSFKGNEPSEEELFFRKMWKGYYDTIAIEERENPKCRMSFMPKRYWNNMTEMQKDTQSVSGRIKEKSLHTA